MKSKEKPQPKITIQEGDLHIFYLQKEKWNSEKIISFFKQHYAPIEISINDLDEKKYVVTLKKVN